MKHSKTLFFSFFFTLIFTSEAYCLDIWQKYSKLSALSSNFSQEKEMKGLGVKLKSQGSMSFKKPDFFEWNVKSPKSFGFVFKNNGIELLENGKVVKSADTTKFDPKMLNAISHLKAWLTLDQKFIESHYEIKKLAGNLYEFTPIGEMKIFKSIKIETHDKYPIKKIQLIELSNDQINIEFTDTKMTYEN